MARSISWFALFIGMFPVFAAIAGHGILRLKYHTRLWYFRWRPCIMTRQKMKVNLMCSHPTPLSSCPLTLTRAAHCTLLKHRLHLCGLVACARMSMSQDPTLWSSSHVTLTQAAHCTRLKHRLYLCGLVACARMSMSQDPILWSSCQMTLTRAAHCTLLEHGLH